MQVDMQDRPEDLLPFYALGTLSELERAQVEAYLAEHPDARAELNEMQVAASALAHLAGAAAPPARVREALLRRVRPSLRPGSRPALGWRLATAASLLLAVGAAAWAISLESKVVSLEAQTAALRQQVAGQEQVWALVVAPEGRVVELSGTQVRPEASGRLYASPHSESALLVMAGLQPLPEDSVYQLWLIEGDDPVSVGFLEVDAQGVGSAILIAPAPVGSFGALGISIEPPGGSPSPQGDIVVLSVIRF
jgi:anti-sigma-K factor RskA